MLSLPSSTRIWLATRPTDLRKSFDTLAELVRQQLQNDPLSGQLFVFRNKRDLLALIHHDHQRLQKLKQLANLWQRRLERPPGPSAPAPKKRRRH